MSGVAQGVSWVVGIVPNKLHLHLLQGLPPPERPRSLLGSSFRPHPPHTNPVLCGLFGELRAAKTTPAASSQINKKSNYALTFIARPFPHSRLMRSNGA